MELYEDRKLAHSFQHVSSKIIKHILIRLKLLMNLTICFKEIGLNLAEGISCTHANTFTQFLKNKNTTGLRFTKTRIQLALDLQKQEYNWP